jgi:hypothetical protein
VAVTTTVLLSVAGAASGALAVFIIDRLRSRRETASLTSRLGAEREQDARDREKLLSDQAATHKRTLEMRRTVERKQRGNAEYRSPYVSREASRFVVCNH